MPTVDELVKLVCVRVAFARSINKKNTVRMPSNFAVHFGSSGTQSAAITMEKGYRSV